MAKRIQRYETEDIVVTFDPNRCIHTGRCLQGLPDVFDTSRRRWIALEAATADEVAATVETCPSGALQYERLDGGAAEVPDRPTSVRPMRKGPLYLRGEIELTDARGETTTIGPRATLCRCGASENKPFCDLSHRTVGFEG